MHCMPLVDQGGLFLGLGELWAYSREGKREKNHRGLERLCPRIKVRAVFVKANHVGNHTAKSHTERETQRERERESSHSSHLTP